MDLAKARAHVLPHHHARALQGFTRRQGLPGIGTQVIPAQQHPLAGKSFFIRQREHEIAKLCGLESGVATVLVHLVGSRLD